MLRRSREAKTAGLATIRRLVHAVPDGAWYLTRGVLAGLNWWLHGGIGGWRSRVEGAAEPQSSIPGPLKLAIAARMWPPRIGNRSPEALQLGREMCYHWQVV